MPQYQGKRNLYEVGDIILKVLGSHILRAASLQNPI
ncbi:hypothetical protein UABAM_01141 [Candidatus Uabimicrobium amorphum]|uniref:Uncharacterized protein n=1 Tax=Uabimicrobium amorphum TaxID=2596890 RepID=A0A5S9IJ44_UABAM|nr:hypothetical protein UABAM_01141 [Candidatus Uabimicrobium amorphum]